MRINESGTYITGGVTSCAETGFTEHLQYDPESGFRTAETTSPFKVLAAVAANEVEMVPPAGFEPATP
nr:recombinase [Rhizobium sp. Q54]